jgi:hypothetical protein
MTAISSGRWPSVQTTLARRSCRGEAASYTIFGSTRPERESMRLVSTQGGPVAYEGEDIISPFGADVLVRQKNRALAIRDMAGKESIIVPADCAGRLVHADPARKSVVVACIDRKHQRYAELRLYGTDGARPLGGVSSPEGDSWTAPPNRIVKVHDLYLDMDARSIVGEPPLKRSEVRTGLTFARESKGVYAERGDGLVLGVDTVGQDPEVYEVPVGPLRWRRP